MRRRAHLLLHATSSRGIFHSATIMTGCKDHALLLKVFIPFTLPQLDDVVFALPELARTDVML